jgi:hypothetical protein
MHAIMAGGFATVAGMFDGYTYSIDCILFKNNCRPTKEIGY